MGWMSKRIWTATFLLLLGAGVCFVVIVQGKQQSIPMPDESLVDLTVEHEGTTYKLVNGDLYRVASPDRLVFVKESYDPAFREKHYSQQNGQPFESIRTLASGIQLDGTLRTALRTRPDQRPDRRGSGLELFPLQSSSTPSVPEYVQLRNRILRGEAKFIDNPVKPARRTPTPGSRH